MRGLFSLVQRWAALILCLGLVLTAWSGYYTVKLYQNLRTDLEELLPRSSRSVRDLDEVTRRLRSIDNLAILVFSKDTEASKRFVTDLATRIEKFPSSEVAGVEYRIDREIEFFRKRQALYMEPADLLKIRDYVRNRIAYETSLYNPLNLLSGDNIPQPEMDFRALERKYERRAGDFAHFPGGYFATPDERKRVLLVDVPGKTLGIDGIKRLKSGVEDAIRELRPRSYAPDLEIHYTGSVEEMLEEQDALVEDLAVSTIAVMILVTAAMLLFFRSIRVTFALVAALLASTCWTFGLAYFVVGYLNANSAFLGSIVLGNGINFGIILLARYMEERRLARSHLRATRIALSTTAKATLTAALAAAFSYGSLMATSFRGFRQFGIIGLMGMALCWLGTYTLLPALLALIERVKPLRRRELRPRKGAWLTGGIAAAISRCPRLIAGIALLLTAVSVVSMTRANSGLLETNLENLRSKKSTESGAAYYTQYINQIFQRFLTPIVILPSSRANALEIADRLKALKRKQGRESAIVSVQTIDDFVPKDQREKIAILKEIRKSLKPKILASLSPADRHKVDILLTGESFHEFGISDLPPLVRDKFVEKDGSLGKLVLVEPPLSRDIWQGDHLGRFVGELRATADSVEPGAPVAGGMAVTADLLSSISHDGPRATILALVSVIVLVILLFRELRIIVMALLALLIGVCWFGGLVVAFADDGLRINFLNFVALPITFGIGVDYGVNVFERYRRQRREGITQIIRETGGAVGLSSMTTIIGYSSLLMASNRGFVSFGLLAVLGELTCVSAALIALPAILESLKGARQPEMGGGLDAGAEAGAGDRIATREQERSISVGP